MQLKQKRLGVWLRWESACLPRPGVQIPVVLAKRKKLVKFIVIKPTMSKIL
jgi:hypothetical protein